jgi:hypothetical protein
MNLIINNKNDAKESLECGSLIGIDYEGELVIYRLCNNTLQILNVEGEWEKSRRFDKEGLLNDYEEFIIY